VKSWPFRKARRLAPLLPILLAGCVDARLSVEVTSPATASVAVTQEVRAETMIALDVRAGKTNTVDGFQSFCRGGARTLRAARGVSCTRQASGTFRTIMGARSMAAPVQFASAGPDLVRVSIPIAAVEAQIAAHQPRDADALAALPALLAGRGLTLHVEGGTVVSSNMDIAADLQAADKKISLLGLLQHSSKLPEEYFAVLRVHP